jgi:hypothetical protein
MIAGPDQAAEPTAYSYKPSLLGAPWSFRLEPDAIAWEAGLRHGRIAYGDVRRVRLSFRPANMQPYRFLAEVWSAAGPKIAIASSSWRSMVEQQRQDSAYSAFIMELHRRLVAARVAAVFDAGSPVLLYWPGVAIFVAGSLALAGLIAIALQRAAWAGAAMIAGLLALFLWQVGSFFKRNRPGRYRPEDLPRTLLP